MAAAPLRPRASESDAATASISPVISSTGTAYLARRTSPGRLPVPPRPIIDFELGVASPPPQHWCPVRLSMPGLIQHFASSPDRFCTHLRGERDVACWELTRLVAALLALPATKSSHCAIFAALCLEIPLVGTIA